MAVIIPLVMLDGLNLVMYVNCGQMLSIVCYCSYHSSHFFWILCCYPLPHFHSKIFFSTSFCSCYHFCLLCMS